MEEGIFAVSHIGNLMFQRIAELFAATGPMAFMKKLGNYGRCIYASSLSAFRLLLHKDVATHLIPGVSAFPDIRISPQE